MGKIAISGDGECDMLLRVCPDQATRARRLVMTKQGFASVSVHFASLEDPRVSRSRLHALVNVLVIGLCAVICGASGFTEMEEFGKRRRKWLGKFLDLSSGIPSHDTFNAVFARLKPDAFERC